MGLIVERVVLLTYHTGDSPFGRDLEALSEGAVAERHGTTWWPSVESVCGRPFSVRGSLAALCENPPDSSLIIRTKSLLRTVRIGVTVHIAITPFPLLRGRCVDSPCRSRVARWARISAPPRATPGASIHARAYLVGKQLFPRR